MRFVEYGASELEYVRKCLASDDKEIREHAQKKWDSWFVVATKNDVTMSTPNYNEDLGFYFQPRAGTGSPVILLDDVIELHRVMDLPDGR